MIIQCDHCSAKFRIDDAKLANGAVKVRCAKCKEVFVVEREEPPVEAVQPPQVVVPPPVPADLFSEGFSENNEFSFDQTAASGSTVTEASSAADEFDWKETAVKLDTTDTNTEFDSFSAVAEKALLPQTTMPADADNDFDFGDINLQSSPEPAKPTSATQPHEDFSIDFGEVSFAEPPPSAAVAAAAAVAPATADFSFDTDSSADSEPVGGTDDFLLSFTADQVEELQPPVPPAQGGENVDFGDFNFGDMDDDVKGEQVLAQAPLSLPEKDVDSEAFPATFDEELVPTSLASRKRSDSRFPLFLILGAILLIVALAGSGVYFFSGPKAFTKVGLGFLVDWYGEKAPEEGSIAIRNIVSSYVVNSSAGELFVVKGEAVNNFKKPRASVQVKVSILGPKGVVLFAKSAYCGNSLSSEQLISLPLAKIEEAMNNQFGDSLANLGVKPGSAIPFVVVMSGVPKEATDYSVKIAGSTVATQ